MSGTLYGIALSQPVRSCLMLIKEGDLNVTFEQVNLMTGAHKQEPFLSINPAGQIPAYAEGDFKLAEGGAILAYLAETHNLTNWYPSDPKAKAKVNQWMHWYHTNIRKSSKCVMAPTLFGSPLAVADFEACLPVLENALGKSKFIASEDHPTIADLFFLPELDQLGADFFGEDIFDFSPYPNVVRYLAELQAAVPSYAQNKADAVGICAMIRSSKK